MANSARNIPGKQQESTIEEVNPLLSLQEKYEAKKKPINTALTIIVVVIVGYFAYDKLIAEPKENKAMTAIAHAQAYFAQDSASKALNGDGANKGFLSVIKTYSGTKAGNLANYYAGLCYLQMKDAKNAIKYLKDFNAHGTDLEYMAYGALGDAYMDMGNTKEGIESYMKAAGDKKDIAVTPLYLYRAAVAYEMDKQNDKAIENFKRIRDEYPQSQQARETEKELARLGFVGE
jgi:tetratricopeptide (TPR) repeat protein